MATYITNASSNEIAVHYPDGYRTDLPHGYIAVLTPGSLAPFDSVNGLMLTQFHPGDWQLSVTFRTHADGISIDTDGQTVDIPPYTEQTVTAANYLELHDAAQNLYNAPAVPVVVVPNASKRMTMTLSNPLHVPADLFVGNVYHGVLDFMQEITVAADVGPVALMSRNGDLMLITVSNDGSASAADLYITSDDGVNAALSPNPHVGQNYQGHWIEITNDLTQEVNSSATWAALDATAGAMSPVMPQSDAGVTLPVDVASSVQTMAAASLLPASSLAPVAGGAPPVPFVNAQSAASLPVASPVTAGGDELDAVARAAKVRVVGLLLALISVLK